MAEPSFRGWTPKQISQWKAWETERDRRGLIPGSDREWKAWLEYQFGPSPERDANLRVLDIDRRATRAPIAPELRNAREAQKWADVIQRRDRDEFWPAARELESLRPPLDEIPIWDDEQSARLRYIARTGRFPPPNFDWQTER